MKITQKIATGVATGALLLQMAQPAFAATYTITNSTNGRDSQNSGTIQINRESSVYQTNNVQIDNNINQNANTGDNKVQDNLGGVDVKTGDVNQEASVVNNAGENVAQLQQCDCDYDVEIVNEKNGRDSENTAAFNATQASSLMQTNNVDVNNKLKQNANTGDNALKDNNSDTEVSVQTGDVDQDASVETLSGGNHAVLGSRNGGSSSFSLTNSTNGRDSENSVFANVNHSNVAVQSNEVDVDNNLDQHANTGDNDAKDNLGGAAAETGSVDQTAKIANTAGANVLAAGDCMCDVDVEVLNEKNGRDTENEAGLELSFADLFQQFNDELSFDNNADQHGATGDNQISDNNSDDMNTGDVDSDVEVHNTAGQNVIGDTTSDLHDLSGDWNGASILMMLMHLLS
ncbi:hypothetical protein HGA91_00705 [candidate division WWE3 bacterium]|nr:hypothetical protein [candidate division WWE3 bacterium]